MTWSLTGFQLSGYYHVKIPFKAYRYDGRPVEDRKRGDEEAKEGGLTQCPKGDGSVM